MTRDKESLLFKDIVMKYLNEKDITLTIKESIILWEMFKEQYISIKGASSND